MSVEKQDAVDDVSRNTIYVEMMGEADKTIASDGWPGYSMNAAIEKDLRRKKHSLSIKFPCLL